jgi:hypothetical protein
MTLAPTGATNGTIKINTSTVIGGVSNAKFGDKTQMKDVTSLGDTAKMQYPTIQEWNLSFDITYDAADSGQSALFASKANKTNLPYRVYVTATKYYACAGGYVESIEFSLEPSDVSKASVTIASHDAAVFT